MIIQCSACGNTYIVNNDFNTETFGCEICGMMGYMKEIKTQTNFDKITATVEALAEALGEMRCDWCVHEVYGLGCHKSLNGDGLICKQGIKAWLRATAE